MSQLDSITYCYMSVGIPKADIDNLIRDTLWNGLPECYDELSISSCRQRIYEYVYTRYKNVA